MENKKIIWVWVGVAVVVIGVVAAFVWPRHNQGNPAAVYAPKGQLVPQFPKSLVLHALGGVTNSYSIGYNASTSQYTGEFDSSNTVDFIYNQYLNYFLSNHWTVENIINNNSSSRGLYVTTSTADASVAISAEPKGSHVTIGYLTK